jgi:hypothetical protein
MMHASGVTIEENSDIQHFRGIVGKTPGSFVAVTVSESGIQGSIFTKEKLTCLSPDDTRPYSPQE